jgi:uncharacterized protein involved in exopolysaccharide biosynthesis
MTPEERFTEIENLLQTLTEKHVQFEIEHEKMQAVSQKIQQEHLEIATYLKEWSKSISRVSAAQEITEARLQALIAHVDGHEGRIRDLEG